MRFLFLEKMKLSKHSVAKLESFCSPGRRKSTGRISLIPLCLEFKHEEIHIAVDETAESNIHVKQWISIFVPGLPVKVIVALPGTAHRLYVNCDRLQSFLQEPWVSFS